METKEKFVIKRYLACLLAFLLLVGLVGFGFQPIRSNAVAYGSWRVDIATVANNTNNGLDRGTYDDVYIRIYSGNDATGTLIYQSADLGDGKTNGGNSGSLSMTDVPTSSAIKSIQIIKPDGTDDWGCDYWKVYYIPAGGSAIYICGEDPDQWKCGDGGYRTINVTWFQDHNRSITFDGNGASTGSTPTQYLVYGTADLLNTNGFLRLGYTFTGWAATAGGAVAYAQNASFTMPDSNQTLYAKWTPNTYTVKYNGNGNTGGAMSNSSHTYDVAKNLTANAFTKTGYTFTGWQDEAEATYTDAQSVVNLTPENNEEFNLYAQWTANTYYIVFNGNGNTGGSMANQAVTYNTTVNLTSNAFVRTGYTFIGWATSAEGPVVYNDFQSINNLTTVAGAQIQLYAKWVAHNYTVTYNGNGATGGSTANSSHVYDVAKNLTLNGYARTGYTFLGWATVPGGSAVYQNGESVVNLTPGDNATFTLYAVWSANNYLITFNANGGEGGTSSYMTYGAALTAPIVTRTGYAFTGWTPGVPATVPAANSTYTANWVLKSYTITFNANGGTGGYTQTMPYGSELVAPTVTRDGYYFIGWLPEVPGTVPAANTTYVAQWSSTAFTITFDAAGGTGSAVYTLPEGMPMTPPVVTRTGYTFTGWNPAVPPTSPGANTTYYAMWTKNIYTIIFDANGGNGTAAYDLEYEAPLTAPVVSREGYTFAGWDPAVPPTVPAANTTFTAQWTANSYTITFNANGGTGGTIVTQAYGTALVAPTVTRQGYTFVEWSPAVPPTVPASNATYIAQWAVNSYMICFDANGGEGSTCAALPFDTQLTAPTVTKPGYTLSGWAPALPPTVPASDATYTAQWTANTYTVAFDGSTATAGSTASQTFTYDDIERPLRINGYTKTGYTFAGWAASAGGAVVYTDEQPVRNLTAQAGATVTLYAVWSPNSYTITFLAAGGEGGTSGPMFYGDPLIPPTVTRTGYTFTGWQPEPPATVGIGDAMYVAQWTANQYTVVYDGNGATGGATESTVHTYDGYKVLAFNGYSRTGHNFVNWNTAPDGTGTAYEAAQSVLNLATEGTVTLYAQWAASTYQVLMSPNGGTGNIIMQGITYNQSANLQPNTFTRAGYTFAGWNTAADGSGTPYADEAMYGPMQFPNEWLYAQWSPISYQITFDAAGGEGGTSAAMPFGSPLIPPVVTKSGYDFAGWLPEPPATVPAEDAVFVAQWVESQDVTVTFDLNGGTGTVPGAQTGLPGSAAALPAQGDIARQYYTFLGWAETAGATQALASYNYPAADATLYAVWQREPVTLAKGAGSTTVFAAEAGVNYIYGLEEGITEQAFRNQFVQVNGDGRLQITQVEGSFGTGTRVDLYDNVTDALLATYWIVIFGDVDGDGYVTAADENLIDAAASYQSEFVYGTAAFYAADIMQDGGVDALDLNIVSAATSYTGVLDQANPGVII